MQTERQIQIIERSIELIANHGIQGFTIKNLSKAIGISEPAIYRHFDSKTGILIAILNNFKEMSDMMSFMIAGIEGTAIEKVKLLFSKMFEIFAEQPAIISVIFSEEIFQNEIVLKDKILEIHNIQQSNIENIIAAGQADKSIRLDMDKGTIALILMGSLRLLVKRWELNNQNFNLELEGEKLMNSFKVLMEK